MTDIQINIINNVLSQVSLSQEQKTMIHSLIDLRLKASVPQDLNEVISEYILFVTWLR